MRPGRRLSRLRPIHRHAAGRSLSRDRRPLPVVAVTETSERIPSGAVSISLAGVPTLRPGLYRQPDDVLVYRKWPDQRSEQPSRMCLRDHTSG